MQQEDWHWGLLYTYQTSGLNIAKRMRYRPAPTPPDPMITNRGINWSNNNNKKIIYYDTAKEY